MDTDYQLLREKIESLTQNSITPADFKKVSAPLGIYEQKNALFMIRVRVTGGDIHAPGLSRLAEICQDNDIHNAHITTRQDIQMHDVQLKNIYPAVIQSVKKGFPFRGGGGDTFRNIMVDEYSDISPDAVFDVRPHAFALNRFILGYDHAFGLPRKIKIGFFPGTNKNNASLFQDLSFNAVKLGNKKAFDVYAGGGLGRESRKGVKIFSALPEREIFRCAAAGIELFNDHGNREKRSEARLRFVLNRLGEQKFVEMFLQYFEKSNVDNGEKVFDIDEKISNVPIFEEKTQKDTLYAKWLEHCAHATGVKDIYSLKIVVPGGNIETRHLIPFSDLAAKYSGGVIRLLRSQDILLPRVHRTALPYIYEELRSGNLSIFLHASLRCKIVSCIGAEVCKIGILDSAKFASELSRSLDVFFEGFSNVSTQDKLQIIDSIRISGCPNSCAGHVAAPLGFEGMKRNIDGQSEACFRVFTGGCQEAEKSRLAVTKDDFHIRAEHLQAFIKELVASYLKLSGRPETFLDYVLSIGANNINNFYKFDI
ncbi:MAG: hypothetical protein A2020_04890 [Lentisphaerae bacterium GWF2_45_14]|nr:MAG: hypothetical protein A2020_04890 [Lentisphaerae bacterium GWF2_45_14]